MKKYDLGNTGRRIAEIRRAGKMTQEALADRLNVSSKHISHVERGTASLSIKNLVEICNIFGCSLDYLILGEFHDTAISKIPNSLLLILRSNDEKEIERLTKFMQFYADWYEDSL